MAFNSDNFADELESMIDSVSTGKEVVSMDEAQRREAIYNEWLVNMGSVWRALDRNRKVILAPGHEDVNEASQNQQPIVALLREHEVRSPDRMIFSPAYEQKGKPEEAARMVKVSYWPTFFPEDYDDNDNDIPEKDFNTSNMFKIDDITFKKELAMFIAGKLDG